MGVVQQARLPEFGQVAYDPELQMFFYSFDNGGMVIVGNHMSTADVGLASVVLDLSRRVDHLERQLQGLIKKGK